MSETPLTQNIRPGEAPLDRKAYERAGGYRALRKALTEMDPSAIQQEIKDSNLRGRGGGGFPTGMKWGFMPGDADPPVKSYLLANADEMEPGTFKDRLLMEGDPHQFVEALVVSAFAVGAQTAYIFLRDEYRPSARLLQRAIDEARAVGYIGHDILGSGIDVEVHIHTSAGRYICGEETALINALEGKRAVPRDKPPFPQQAGLWGRPTVVNNVETLCNVPHIVNHGSEWFHGLSRTENGGTKLYGASGHVRNPGCWELPMGATVRELLDEHAGGMRAGYAFRGCLPGGGSTPFLTTEHLDLPLDFDSVSEVGSRLGTGTIIVLDDQTSLMGFLRNLEAFYARESCGWCTPCRDGLPWVAKILGDLEAGRGDEGDIDLLRMHTQFLGPGRTFCAHTPGAMGPLESALEHFPDDFRRGVAAAPSSSPADAAEAS
ncbi:MAG: NADH-quinone oxidoreductase subunit NuoF [Halofilum sp. (in: g-proteobacteria)]